MLLLPKALATSLGEAVLVSEASLNQLAEIDQLTEIDQLAEIDLSTIDNTQLQPDRMDIGLLLLGLVRW